MYNLHSMRGERGEKRDPLLMVPAHLRQSLIAGSEKEAKNAGRELAQWSRVTGVPVPESTWSQLKDARVNYEKSVEAAVNPNFRQRIIFRVRGLIKREPGIQSFLKPSGEKR